MSIKRSVMGTVIKRSKYTLPDLPYDYGALEPVIAGEIMRLHHQKHHHTYVTNLNAALDQFNSSKATVSDIAGLLSLAIRFNGGGHANHTLFWRNLRPPRDDNPCPPGRLLDALGVHFGSLESFKKAMTMAAVGVQGSGWAWLGVDGATGKLRIGTTSNQDVAETVGLRPLLGFDVWEHAYYLQYRNVRADYVQNLWKCVNWDDVADRYAQHISS